MFNSVEKAHHFCLFIYLNVLTWRELSQISLFRSLTNFCTILLKNYIL